MKENLRTIVGMAGCCALLMAALAIPSTAYGQDQSGTPSSTQPDNSAQNKAHHHTTADQQSNAKSDLQITRQIRQAIVKDKSLSTYAHNVKVITKDGMVTLKGPVKSEDEKTAVASKAAEVAGGQDKVTDQLTVKQ